MSPRARVTTIDALPEMAGALDRFRLEVSAALDDLDMEVRRALEWIHHDAKDYWKKESRRGSEKVSEARIQLQQATTMRRMADHTPTCIDEKKALEKAKRRLQMADDKVLAVQRWAHAIDRAADDYRAARGPVAGWLDSELPKALAALKRMREALEIYVRMQAPVDPGKPITGPAHEQDPKPEEGS
jgi:hypothetical protein